MKTIILLLTMLILSGCYRPNWYRPNTTYAQLNEDSNFCWSSLKLGATREEKISEYEKCMKEKDYLNLKEPVRSKDDKQAVVLVFDFGQYYHKTTCEGMKRLRMLYINHETTIEEAEKKGFKPCPDCFK